MTDALQPPWRLRRGATLTDGGVSFSVWAPAAERVSVRVEGGGAAGEHPLARSTTEREVFEARIAGVRAGDRYGFRLDGGEPRADPVSRSQPDGVHGLSEVIDPDAFTWTDQAWRGLALADYVIYELHTGTFTPEGTFDAVIGRLPDLVQLGITAIELMPVHAFPGRRNWGYDGVLHYAVQHSYGGPDGLRRLVNAAHAHGLAVVLDVVYNHVGPEGNRLDEYGPYSTDTYRTPWGRAMNYDGPGSDGVRRWAHDNALYWITEYHVDALRLDAVHGIFDFGALTFLEELSDRVHALGRQLGRKVQLMAESDLNDPRVVRPPEEGGFGVDAQWADDFHHTLHTTLTGERGGYYVDFQGIATMADVYGEPFFYARKYQSFRGRTHGRPSTGVPRQRFIVYAQNHDQVGNRAHGDRLSTLVREEQLRASAALTLLSPYIPLLFMGEEYAEPAPFHYFIEHGDAALVEAVRDGRRREFPDLASNGAIADPQSEETFARSRLDWSRRESESGARLLALYRDLLALRREEPALRPGASEARVERGAGWFTVLRTMPEQQDIYDAIRLRRALFCAFNVSDRAQEIPVRTSGPGGWRLRLSTDGAGYGGAGTTTASIPPAAADADTSDAPKRLLATGRATPTISLAPWTAAVYVRDDTPAGAEVRS